MTVPRLIYGYCPCSFIKSIYGLRQGAGCQCLFLIFKFGPWAYPFWSYPAAGHVCTAGVELGGHLLGQFGLSVDDGGAQSIQNLAGKCPDFAII